MAFGETSCGLLHQLCKEKGPTCTIPLFDDHFLGHFKSYNSYLRGKLCDCFSWAKKGAQAATGGLLIDQEDDDVFT